jgi:hypothetical protein
VSNFPLVPGQTQAGDSTSIDRCHYFGSCQLFGEVLRHLAESN